MKKSLETKKPNQLKKKSQRSSGKHEEGPSKWIMYKELSPDCADVSAREMRAISETIRGRYQKDLKTVHMVQDFLLTSDGSGNVANVIGSNPNPSANWSNFVLIFDEYRVLGITLSFKPFSYVNTTGGLVLAPIARAIDLDTAAAMTSYTLVAQYSSYQETPGGKPWRTTALMSGIENSGFTSTAAPVNTWYVKLYSSGNTISTNLGRLEIEWTVQFRGKGI